MDKASLRCLTTQLIIQLLCSLKVFRTSKIIVGESLWAISVHQLLPTIDSICLAMTSALSTLEILQTRLKNNSY